MSSSYVQNTRHTLKPSSNTQNIQNEDRHASCLLARSPLRRQRTSYHRPCRHRLRERPLLRLRADLLQQYDRCRRAGNAPKVICSKRSKSLRRPLTLGRRWRALLFPTPSSATIRASPAPPLQLAAATLHLYRTHALPPTAASSATRR